MLPGKAEIKFSELKYLSGKLTMEVHLDNFGFFYSTNLDCNREKEIKDYYYDKIKKHF